MFLWFQVSAVSWSGGVKEPVSPMGLLRYHWINFGMFSGCSMNWDWIEFIESYPSSTWNSSSSRSSTSSTSPAQKPYKTLAISSNQIDINCRYTPGKVLHKFHNTWVFTRFFSTESHPGVRLTPTGATWSWWRIFLWVSTLGSPRAKPGRFRCVEKVAGGWRCVLFFSRPTKKKAPKGTLKFQIPDEVVVSFAWNIHLFRLAVRQERGEERIREDKSR